MTPGISLIVTGDGSHSLKNETLNETYHSLHGAVQESAYVFIKKGLDYWCRYYQGAPAILEIGFGTGLNALLTLAYAADRGLRVSFETLETFPLSADLYEALNYPEKIGRTDLSERFLQIHRTPWNEPQVIGEQLHLLKRKLSVHDYQPERRFNIIYFDAFAPSRQPDMWQADIINKMYESLAPGGVLVTYCAQGQFKRNLKAAGFGVETLPGPPGKKEMVRAAKPGPEN